MPRTTYPSGASGGLDTLQAGFWLPPGAPWSWATPTLTTALSVGSMQRFLRFVCPRTMTITRMAFYLQAAATNADPVDVGICSANGQTLIGSSGSLTNVLNSAPGLKTLNLQAGAPLTAGTVYYAIFGYTASATAAQVWTMNSGIAGILTAFGTTLGTIEGSANTTAPPLAAPFTINGSGRSDFPITALLQ